MRTIAILLCLAVVTATILAAPRKKNPPIKKVTTTTTTTTTISPPVNSGCAPGSCDFDGQCYENGQSWPIYDGEWQGHCECYDDGGIGCVL